MYAQAISNGGLLPQSRDLRAARSGDSDEPGIEQSGAPRYLSSTTQTVDWPAARPGSLGALLDALPVPAMLIDEVQQVAAANQGCRFVSDRTETGGLPFESLLALPRDLDRVRILKERARGVIDEAFLAHGPRVAEAILTLGGRRVWARLQMRKIRIEGERYLLILVQDVTQERVRERIDKAAIASLAAMNQKLRPTAPK